MKRKSITYMILILFITLSTGTPLFSENLVKQPIKSLNAIPRVTSTPKLLKSRSRLVQSPGTVLDSTYYDWQRNGGMDDHLATADAYGTPIVNGTMMVSYQEDTSDRTMRYYHWNGANWYGHGEVVFPTRNGFGSLSQFSDGRVALCSHTNLDGGGTRAYAAYDAYPGLYAFSFHGTSITNQLIWPKISVNSDASICMVATDQGTHDVSVAKAPDEYTDFGEWSNLRPLSPDWIDGDMEWPVIHSGENGRVGVVIPDVAGAIRYYHSSDNGDNFTANIIAPADTAGLPTGMDSTAARLGWLNSDLMYIGTEPHVVWSAGQGVDTGGGFYGLYDFKSTIFHWSPSTGRDTVVVAWTQSADSTRNDYVPTPYNHLSVDWPSIGLASDDQTLVVVFTAFNTEDIDETALPPAGFIDIWATASKDNGDTWSEPVNITNPDGTVLGWDDRYPSIAKENLDNSADPGKDVYLIYQSDDLAGTFVQGTESATNMDYIKFVGFHLDILSSDLVLAEPDPGIAGMENTFAVSNATPGEFVKFSYGFDPGTQSNPECLGVTIDIDHPRGFGNALADSSGDARLTVFVPEVAGGQSILFQAVEKANCRTSNLVKYNF